MRLYKYRVHPFIWGFIVFLVIIFSSIIVFLDVKSYWYFIIFPFSVSVFALCYEIKVGFFEPIFLSEKGVKFRKKLYTWDEVKLTAYMVDHRSIYAVYNLLIDNKYVNSKEKAKKILKSGFWVHLRYDVIVEFRKYYHQRIHIVDKKGYPADLFESQKLKDLVNQQS